MAEGVADGIEGAWKTVETAAHVVVDASEVASVAEVEIVVEAATEVRKVVGGGVGGGVAAGAVELVLEVRETAGAPRLLLDLRRVSRRVVTEI